MSALFELTALQAAEQIRNGQLSAYELTSACLDRISARDEQVHAWQYIDYEGALAAAKRADASSEKNGLLHGVPVGLKDIIDTRDMPTTYGSAAYRDHQPGADAQCVNALREQGAIILGKTVTTEFAFFAPGSTVNPHNHKHTPGGSSSGSAAAVADFHIPLSLGTQTAGSIIRPASFNGIFGYKPSYNAYPNQGIHPLAPSLDTLGTFARSVDDLSLLGAVLGTQAQQVDTLAKPPRLAVVRTPYWSQGSIDMRNAFNDFLRLAESNGVAVVEAAEAIPSIDDQILEISKAQFSLMALEAKDILAPIAAEHGELIRAETKNLIDIGLNAPPNAMDEIHSARTVTADLVQSLFELGDVIATPSALGAAPEGIDATGDPVFNRAWTFARLPCIHLPLAKSTENLPLGLQIVGSPSGDSALLSYAKFFADITPFQITLPV